MQFNGLCAQPGFEAAADSPSLWESRRPRESAEAMANRHRKARVACQRCPLIRECERMLSDHEIQGIPIDGVVAARYSDVGYKAQPRRELQSVCMGCGESLLPQKMVHDNREDKRRKPHVGEGLCRDCYPIFARFSPDLKKTN